MLLTLLTDFGLRDVYVGVMKGTIAQIAPQLTIVDLTHDIPPQDVAAARFNLLNAVPYFPPGTVHVAVVDPGVGGKRRAIAVQIAPGYLVGPDNGVFGGVLEQYPAIAAVALTQTAYWRTLSPSATFHGRDIFAPVGAHLASGVALEQLGEAIDPATLIHLPLPRYERSPQGFVGCIQYSDHFGNLVTNIPGDRVAGYRWQVQVATQSIPGKLTYSDCAFGNLLGLVGSHGWIEIAVNGGNARSRLGATVGDRVQVEILHQEADRT